MVLRKGFRVFRQPPEKPLDQQAQHLSLAEVAAVSLPPKFFEALDAVTDSSRLLRHMWLSLVVMNVLCFSALMLWLGSR